MRKPPHYYLVPIFILLICYTLFQVRSLLLSKNKPKEQTEIQKSNNENEVAENNEQDVLQNNSLDNNLGQSTNINIYLSITGEPKLVKEASKIGQYNYRHLNQRYKTNFHFNFIINETPPENMQNSWLANLNLTKISEGKWNLELYMLKEDPAKNISIKKEEIFPRSSPLPTYSIFYTDTQIATAMYAYFIEELYYNVRLAETKQKPRIIQANE